MIVLTKTKILASVGAVAALALVPTTASAFGTSWLFGGLKIFKTKLVHAPAPKVTYSSKGYGSKGWGSVPITNHDPKIPSTGHTGSGAPSAAPVAVPEPGTFGLVGLGVAALVARHRRRRSAVAAA